MHHKCIHVVVCMYVRRNIIMLHECMSMCVHFSILSLNCVRHVLLGASNKNRSRSKPPKTPTSHTPPRLTPKPHCPQSLCLPYSALSSRDWRALLSRSGRTGALTIAVIVMAEMIHKKDVRAARETLSSVDAAKVSTRICFSMPDLSVRAPQSGVKMNVIAGVMAPKCPIRLFCLFYCCFVFVFDYDKIQQQQQQGEESVLDKNVRKRFVLHAYIQSNPIHLLHNSSTIVQP